MGKKAMTRSTSVRGFAIRLLPLVAFLLLPAACVEEMKGSILDETPMNRSGETKKLFTPRDDEMVVDEETGLTVVKNVINITFQRGVDRKRIDAIITSVNGRIVGYDIPASLYQVRLAKLDLPALNALTTRLLAEHREVEVASLIFVSVHKNPYYVK